MGGVCLLAPASPGYRLIVLFQSTLTISIVTSNVTIVICALTASGEAVGTHVIGKVLAVTAGRAAPMSVQGETITSGFVKEEVDGRHRVGFDGFEIDDHVDDALDRDRAVLLYQRSHYDAWNTELERNLPAGIFGENLMIEAPPDADIRLGAELRIGTVRMRVTQPRIPCRKMAVRLQEGESFPSRYLRSGRVGFFCSILEPGEIGAGDSIELLSPGAENMSIADMTNIVYLEEPSANRLQRLLEEPLLPKTWHPKVERVLSRVAAKHSDWPKERPLRIRSVKREAIDILSFELDDPDGTRLPSFDAGQFLTVSVNFPGRDIPVQRTYTLSGRTADDLGYRISVKRERAPDATPDVPDGLVSGYLHDSVKAGSIVMARQPMGHFVVEPGSRPVVLVSAGVGITPMLAMLRQLRDCPLKRDVYFFHGARSSEYHAFADEVSEIVGSRDFMHSHILYSRASEQDVQMGRFQAEGRLSASVLESVLPSLRADFYVCGPLTFIEEIVDGLKRRQVSSERIHFEYFGAAPSPVVETGDLGEDVLDADGRAITVTFARSGVTAPWKEGMFSILSLAERSGMRPQASCRTGLCGTCVCPIDKGNVEYVIDPSQKTSDNEVLICCARPTTSITLDL
jgi:ferredoxin-NADP reductase/MOSC domain-containing protein YiiM